MLMLSQFAGDKSPVRGLFPPFILVTMQVDSRPHHLHFGKHGGTRYFDMLEDSFRYVLSAPEL